MKKLCILFLVAFLPACATGATTDQEKYYVALKQANFALEGIYQQLEQPICAENVTFRCVPKSHIAPLFNAAKAINFAVESSEQLYYRENYAAGAVIIVSAVQEGVAELNSKGINLN